MKSLQFIVFSKIFEGNSAISQSLNNYLKFFFPFPPEDCYHPRMKNLLFMVS
tara:strand:+ start:5589 stop:5744 length:156 start_codon:yes stop_codon:yes gene_type:complete